MGSGEMTGTMVEVHKELLARYGAEATAFFIDTPAGFQLNVDHLSKRAADYFRSRVRHPLHTASLKSAQIPALEIERTCRMLRKADYILIGPGSPTYALEQWRRTRIPQVLTEHVQAGGTLVAASAAALTIGRFTLPVYEIYKVGQLPFWAEGLDLLESFGMNLAVMPHWNNAEGGNHDTRFCFMGKPRFDVLEAMLPETTGILGLDEHTALIIDLGNSEALIRGLGRVTLRRNGREQVFDKQDRIALSLLRGETTWADPAPPAAPSQPPAEAGAVAPDEVWDPMPAMAEKIQEMIDHDRIEQAFGLLLKLERHMWDFQEPLQERNALGAAREILRDMLALIGTRLTQGHIDRAACLAPLVEEILALRTQLRGRRQWEAADLLREGLRRAGVEVKDTPDGGYSWRIAEGSQP
jgi:peptidase E